ncbi:chromosome partitioning protein, ParB family [Desulfofundulus australicus DSM 11792]|uniref:Chromosome partitioning protein, ParB family n=1 Tax=Desulfofundulus australicus DSM 11792 TaxID=1121425 RepID=A0A1M5C1T5_9FIRM|nr:ParB/RepB/Spo0J family partition protein [Desulfofundulus australicus]SHF48754.1 chromosome partitioning protein, ParB family [Desulfofundulus australicus DSM 11792]
MSKKRGLGKGLGALIPVDSNDVNGSLQEIRVEDVQPNPRQPRQALDQDKIQELALSIKEHGVVQPIVVRPIAGGRYEIIAGERRWRACRILGLKFIPAIIKDYGDLEASAVSLIENVQREDLNPLEEASAYRRLIDEFGLSQEEIARLVAKSRPFITNTLRLLSLPPEVQDMLSSGVITAGHARAILSLDDAAKQIAAAREVVAHGLNVRETEELVRRFINESSDVSAPVKEKSSPAASDGELVSLEDMLGDVLGTKVRIRARRGGRGVIEIAFDNRDQLDELVNLLLK